MEAGRRVRHPDGGDATQRSNPQHRQLAEINDLTAADEFHLGDPDDRLAW